MPYATQAESRAGHAGRSSRRSQRAQTLPRESDRFALIGKITHQTLIRIQRLASSQLLVRFADAQERASRQCAVAAARDLLVDADRFLQIAIRALLPQRLLVEVVRALRVHRAREREHQREHCRYDYASGLTSQADHRSPR